MPRALTDIKAAARIHTKSALHTLAKIMTCEEAPHAARVAAAQALLNRGWGQPAQAIEIAGELTHNVIRAPQVIDNTIEWSNQHVPIEHRSIEDASQEVH
jgi:hypothetical protein